MKLPTKRKVPPNNINDYLLFIAGDKKVGKSSWATQFPDHFMLEFECGNAKHLNANYEDVRSLNGFDELLQELERNPGYCKTLILDEITILYERLRSRFIKAQGIDDPGDMAYGKGWGMLGKEFDAYIYRIIALDCGIIFTGHSEIKEIKLASGRKIMKLEAALSGRVAKIMDRLVQFWGVMQFAENGDRRMYIIGDDYLKAGHGFNNHFTKVKENYIDLGKTPKEGYDNFISAWNNEEKLSPVIKPKFKTKMKRATK